MKRHVLHLLVVLMTALLWVGCAREADNTRMQVSKGHLDLYPDFPSENIPPRTIRVWTPEDYDPSQRYDVLYMHDGQMLYDASVTWNGQEWGVDEAMDSLIRLHAIRPTIVVGIDYNPENRIGEYCPDDVSLLLPDAPPVYDSFPSKGNDYLRFVVEELKPFIDSVYATYPDREHTWTMGSSCGGLISSYALCKYPEVFAGAACMSTHCTLAYPDPVRPDYAKIAAYREYLRTHIAPNSCRLYMDRGDRTLDAFYSETQQTIIDMFRTEGWDSTHFEYRYFPGHAHCEDDWQARLDQPIIFLLQD